MKIQLIKDFEQFGVNSVIDVDQPTGNRLIGEGIGIQVPDDTRSRKYAAGQQLESLCVPLHTTLNEQNTTITTPPTFIASIGAEMEDKDKTPTTRRQFFTTKK